ncbi:alpha/beta hydrolase [Kribbella sandramycini]|uniref:Alpha/beta hydrolase n=1 Tax=Kribbella sandramycini TaxID=60450 RepID=A0A7Y4L2W7_9ACTN|nr:alpha/beta hydrolase [Kribbella sandramycini]MBB6571215.1 pimeloyl-ACP methyl ester carboxylesterase [Kribbella sandramycini]NOL43378.1 alpha/beta hydrolase [Kribbella sandramycini]
MPVLALADLELRYDVAGDGDLVVLVMGTGAKGNVWTLHQVPALVRAGYRVATFDARGISPMQVTEGFPRMTIDDLVDDLAQLIEHLGAPAHVVGTSLGARVVQELALGRPELVRRVVAMAAHGRLDEVNRRLTAGERLLFDTSVVLPIEYKAALDAILNLSPATLNDAGKARDWLDILAYSSGPMDAGRRGQLELSAQLENRLPAYGAIAKPLLVIGFADDRVIPTYLAREVADVVPGAQYVEIPDAGHFGYLEQPAKVNQVVIDFLADEPPSAHGHP